MTNFDKVEKLISTANEQLGGDILMLWRSTDGEGGRLMILENGKFKVLGVPGDDNLHVVLDPDDLIIHAGMMVHFAQVWRRRHEQRTDNLEKTLTDAVSIVKSWRVK